MVALFVLLFAFQSVIFAQIWEQEIEFSSKKTTRITMPSNFAIRIPTSNTAGESENQPTGDATGNENGPSISPFSDAFMESILKANSSWQTNRNFDDSFSGGYLPALTGLHPNYTTHKLPLQKSYAQSNISIPDEFDARKQWPNCPTVQEIRDQGSCGSCWAISTAEAMSDRVCIHSNATKLFHFSVEDIISCCTECGDGCNGGYPDEAWNYWKKTGIVSGGDYNSKNERRGCRPYTIEPCAHHGNSTTKKKCSDSVKTPECSKQCIQGHNGTYQEDLRYGSDAYSVDGKVEIMQREVLTNGPIVVTFEVYEDFLMYGDGVYQHVQGKKVGGHAVKLLGWGTDPSTNVPYWLCANSWNTDWGKLKGFFKIKRGSNECKIESGVSAGLPKFKKT